MATNQQLITRLRQAKKDTSTDVTRQQRSDATYASILTEAQTFLNRELELCRQEFTVALSAGVAEYAMDSAFVKFPQERLRRKSGLAYWSGGQLVPTDPAFLDIEESGWRAAAAGTTAKFYLQSIKSGADSALKLGLYKKPDATFVAAAPSLTLYGVYRPADIAANGRLPFDNDPTFADMNRLLILHALWTLELEDGNQAKGDERWEKFVDEVELARDWIPGILKSQRGLEFDKDWKP